MPILRRAASKLSDPRGALEVHGLNGSAAASPHLSEDKRGESPALMLSVPVEELCLVIDLRGTGFHVSHQDANSGVPSISQF